MTEDEFKALKVGDDVYTVGRSAHQPNATGDRRLTRRTVTKVNKKSVVVTGGLGGENASTLLTIEAGDAALAEFLRLNAEREALAARWADVKTRLRTALAGAFDEHIVSVGLVHNYINIHSGKIDDAERIASVLEVGTAALKLTGDLRAVLTDDSPAVHLHLSVAQAARVLQVCSWDVAEAECVSAVVRARAAGIPLREIVDELMRRRSAMEAAP